MDTDTDTRTDAHRDIEILPGSVVVGVDTSDGARHALDWAAGVAAIEGRPLVVVHAEQHPAGDQLGFGGYGGVDWVVVRDELRQAQAVTVAAARDHVLGRWPDLDVRTVAVDADPRRVLVEASPDARLVVVGSRGLGRFSGLLLGSVSSALAHHASGTTVVVPGPAPADGLGEGGSGVVHAVVDLGHDSTGVLAEALRLASETGRPVVVHPYHWHDARHAVDDDLRRLLAETVAGYQEDYPDVPITLDTAHGPRAPYYSEHGTPPYPDLGTIPSDLVVVGRPEHRRSLLTGSVPLLDGQTRCPVVVVAAESGSRA